MKRWERWAVWIGTQQRTTIGNGTRRFLSTATVSAVMPFANSEIIFCKVVNCTESELPDIDTDRTDVHRVGWNSELTYQTDVRWVSLTIYPIMNSLHSLTLWSFSTTHCIAAISAKPLDKLSKERTTPSTPPSPSLASGTKNGQQL